MKNGLRLALLALSLSACSQQPDDEQYLHSAYCGGEPVRPGDMERVADYGRNHEVVCK